MLKPKCLRFLGGEKANFNNIIDLSTVDDGSKLEITVSTIMGGLGVAISITYKTIASIPLTENNIEIEIDSGEDLVKKTMTISKNIKTITMQYWIIFMKK